MTLLEFILFDKIKDAALWGLLYKRKQDADAERSVRQWTVRKRIPVIGRFIKKRSGHAASGVERYRNRTAIQGIRWLVNTATFEDVVGMFLNHNAKPLRRPKAKRGNSPRINVIS